MKNMIRKSFFPALLCVMLMAVSCCERSAEPAEVSLIPQPSEIGMGKGVFHVRKDMKVVCRDERLMPAAQYLAEALGGLVDDDIAVSGNGKIVFEIDTALTDGGYVLDVSKRRITMAASGAEGIVSAIATLRQLLPAYAGMDGVKKELVIPVMRIKDAPRFEWRGLMLDAARHFWTKEEIKKILDLMAQYKLNKFHWHLTDDQGWRIEIKAYPELTEKAAWRKFNDHDRLCMSLEKTLDNPDFGLPADRMKIVGGDTLYGGYYSQDDIREVVSYAARRGIDVLPEIDMPGHFNGTIEQFPWLSCDGQAQKGTWFWYPICPGKDTTLEFCKNVYKEVFELFPYEYVHLGADEVVKTKWAKCPDCRRRIKDKGLKSVEELQSWFVHEMEAFFNANGKKMVGWDEIQEGGLSKTATVMWWRTWAPGTLAHSTSHGNKVIACPTEWLYLDYDQTRGSVDKLYEFDPVADSLTDAQKQLVVGMQGNLWAERIPSIRIVEYRYFPRLMVLSEIAWVAADRKDAAGFKKRLNDHFARLDTMKVNYRIPDMYGLCNRNVFIDTAIVEIACPLPSIAIRYTDDGTDPTLNSALYTAPFSVWEDRVIKFRQFRPDGSAGDPQQYAFRKTVYRDAETPRGELKPGLAVVWHDFVKDSCRLIDKGRVLGRFVTGNVSIPKGVTGNVGLIFRGYIDIPQDGIYSFVLNSDDGSVLWIGTELVIDNDGWHSALEKSGQAALRKGLHPIEVRYFDPNSGVLQFGLLAPDGSITILGPEWFKH